MFLSCGDALFDLFTMPENPQGAGPTAVTVSGNAGGSPMNVAVGMARLGHDSGYFTKLSNDVFGQRLRRYLELNELDTSLCIDTELNTTLAIVEKNNDGSANYVFYINNTADVSIVKNELPQTLSGDIKVLHFASYSTVLEPTSSSLLALAQREKGNRFISYDPNLRPSVEPDLDKWREMFEGFANTASLVKASDEDIASLFGENSEDRFVADCFNYGAELVFITRGPDGGSGFNKHGEHVKTPGVKVDVVDTVGAGDTFQAAVIHHLTVNNHIGANGSIEGEVDLKAAAEFAISAAAITCTRAGADLPGLSDLN